MLAKARSYTARTSPPLLHSCDPSLHLAVPRRLWARYSQVGSGAD